MFGRREIELIKMTFSSVSRSQTSKFCDICVGFRCRGDVVENKYNIPGSSSYYKRQRARYKWLHQWNISALATVLTNKWRGFIPSSLPICQNSVTISGLCPIALRSRFLHILEKQKTKTIVDLETRRARRSSGRCKTMTSSILSSPEDHSLLNRERPRLEDIHETPTKKKTEKWMFKICMMLSTKADE